VAESIGVCDAAQGTEAPALVSSLGSAWAVGAAVVGRAATSVVLSVLVVLCRIAATGALATGGRAVRSSLGDVMRKSDIFPLLFSGGRYCYGEVGVRDVGLGWQQQNSRMALWYIVILS